MKAQVHEISINLGADRFNSDRFCSDRFNSDRFHIGYVCETFFNLCRMDRLKFFYYCMFHSTGTFNKERHQTKDYFEVFQFWW
jgi:hypothetical protein